VGKIYECPALLQYFRKSRFVQTVVVVVVVEFIYTDLSQNWILNHNPLGWVRIRILV
jgi:hypothetical protein